LWICNIPIEFEWCKWIYERSYNYLICGERYDFMIDHHSYTHNLSSCEIKAWMRMMQMNIWKIIYLNCGERSDFMIDHRSYTHNLSSCEIKAYLHILWYKTTCHIIMSYKFLWYLIYCVIRILVISNLNLAALTR